MATGNTYALHARVALVTGASGALGAAVVAAFAASGARVVGVTRSEPPQPSSGAHIAYEVADVGDEPSVEALIAKVVRGHGSLDIVVNTVGGFAAGQPVTDLSLDTWDGMWSLNARTAFLISKYAGRVMAERHAGRIINVASRSAYTGRKNAAAYAVSKRAVITLTEAQAEEMRGLGVTVNAIVPSIIDTPTNRAGMPTADTSRWPTSEQVARVVLFLASDDAALISGAAIPVYGDS
jgi:NAD(P)-dependent dehydrogenase (short-subunit alcohol dehydrogenase family)